MVMTLMKHPLKALGGGEDVPSSLTLMCERKLLCGDSFQNRSVKLICLWAADSGTPVVLGRP